MTHEPSERGWLSYYLLPAVAVAAFVAAAVWLLDLWPPDRVSIAAGQPGTAYHALAERYRSILARDGIDVEIVETAGSVENAELLTQEEVDAAFLQGGVPVPDSGTVEALGAVFLEPLWIFHGGALDDPANPARWGGLRIAAGGPGSGTRFVVDAAFRALGLDPSRFDLMPIGGQAAAEALVAGEIDVALFVAPVTAPYLRTLFADPEVAAVSIRDGDSLARRLPFVEMTDIPPASFDYAGRRPPDRIELIAMIGRLVARADLHPALVDRLVEAARQIHGGRDLVTTEGQFPSTAGVDMEMNGQAAALITEGPSPFNRFLPYWVGAQVSKFALLLVPLLVILFPVFRIAPGLYQWQMRNRVWKHYVALRHIEREAQAASQPAEFDGLVQRLDAIEAEVARLRLPVRFREYAYALRVHLDLVRRRIAERRIEAAAVSR